MEPENLAPGYYWVKILGHTGWEIAELSVGSWCICGNECDFYDSDILEIGSRITYPEV